MGLAQPYDHVEKQQVTLTSYFTGDDSLRFCVSPAGGGQQPSAGDPVQRAGQHGPGAAAGRRRAALPAPEHRGAQGQRRRRKKDFSSKKKYLSNLDFS